MSLFVLFLLSLARAGFESWQMLIRMKKSDSFSCHCFFLKMALDEKLMMIDIVNILISIFYDVHSNQVIPAVKPAWV